MKITNIIYDIDTITFCPKLIITLEMPIERLQDIHVSSNFHKQDTLAAIGDELINQITATRSNTKD